MKQRHLLFFTSLFLLLFFAACNSDAPSTETNDDPERPNDPWVFRSVLDVQPRMLTAALHDDLWVAYSADDGKLYKAWRGHVNFDGAVYTTAHGPQPLAVGDIWLQNSFESPWLVQENGQDIPASSNYLGHRFVDDGVEVMYEVSWNDKKARVFERPEYFSYASGLPGFERIFTTQDVPAGATLVLQTNVASIGFANSIETDGEFNVTGENSREYKNVSSVDVEGRLSLKSNDQTRFAVKFLKRPTIADPNRKDEDQADEDTPLGYRLIARNDCKTCHNTYRKTIGPAYVDVAAKYQNTEENIGILTNKVKYGGYGVWGTQVMNAHPDVPEVDIRAMVEYIMSLDAEEEAQLENIATQSPPEDQDYVYGDKNVNEQDLLPGVVARIYMHDKDLTQLSDIDTDQDPAFATMVPNVQASDSDLQGLPNNFAILVDGYLNIRKSSVYHFRLNSDDGSRLTIGTEMVIDHDGLHGASNMDGSIALAEGYHPFRVEFFQGGGGKSLVLSWRTGNSGEYVVVPPAAMVHHKKDQPAEVVASPMGNENRIPGNGYPLEAVHPSYDLAQARPDLFTPKVGGMDFLSDGRLVVSTWDAAGSVFIVEGAQSGDPSQMQVKTIAKGLAEPLGLKVVDDEIYILQKQELTKLVDTNGDEVIDEYQTVCNNWRVSANFHEFAFGLAYKDGYFYGTLATAINPGGASTQPQIQDRGKVVKISKADGSMEFIASGLRTPNGIGIGVDNELFVADNQGDWLPSSKIVHIKQGGWYGSRSVDFEGTANLKEDLPVVWLPQDEIGNSPSTPVYLNDGPYQGQMIHGEVTHGGVKRVFVEKVNEEYQGCVFRFTQGLEAGVNRLVWGPDGALYVGGIGSSGNWQHNGTLWYGLQRLKYNQKPAFEMLAVRAKSNGVEIELTEPLREGDGWNASDYLIKQWYYKPTEEYGGPKLDERELPIRSVNVSEDRRKVFLELSGMKSNHLLYVKIENSFISEKGQGLWTTEAWYTMNNIPQNQPGFRTQAPPPLAPNTLTAAEQAAGWKLLFDGKTTAGWRNFKKQTIGSSWIVRDNALSLDAKRKDDGGWQAADGGDIITDGQYENYELQLEWKIGACGNSGIIYNVVESDDYDYVWQTGPEMQVLDNSCHPDAKIEKHRAGDLYDMIECSFVTVKPAGAWNHIRLVVNNGKVEHWLNGYKVVDFEMFTDEWTQMIQGSKFHEMPGFGKARKGHISLQDHGDPVWYRNIKIREL